MASKRKAHLVDLVVAVMFLARSVESFVIPVLLADRVADSYPGYSGHASLQRHPCEDRNGSSHDAVLDAIQSEASRWSMVYWLTSALPGAVIAILMGGWTDRIGRRLLMAIASLGYAVQSGIAMAVIHWKLPLPVLIAGSSLEGLLGGFPAILLGAYSYASDRSELKNRTVRLVLLELSLCVGNLVGNVSGGLLIKNVGPLAAEALVCACHCFNILYIGLVLGESRDEEQRRHSHTVDEQRPLLADQKLKNPLGLSQSMEPSLQIVPSQMKSSSMYLQSLKTTLGLVFKASPIRARLLVVLFSFEFLVMNYIGAKDITVLYTMHKPLCWTSDFTGYFMAARYAGLSLSLIVFIILSRFFRPQDHRIVQVATFFMICYMAGLAMASHDWIMYLGK